MTQHLTRRSLLAAASTTAVAAIAGCSALGGNEPNTPTEDPYDHLRTRTVFVAAGLDLTLPESVPSTGDPDAADVVVLPATTDRDPATVVGWLTDGTAVALVGHEARPTYHDWQDSDAYAEAFAGEDARASGGASSGDGTPEPAELLVVQRGPDDITSSYAATWGGTDDPSDARLLDKLDDGLDGDSP